MTIMYDQTQRADLTRFAEEFRDEAHLHEILVTLLDKAGCKKVRNNHGRGEKGKDIVFYGEDSLGSDVLYCCIVKHTRITGRVDSPSGAQTVMNQARTALKEPYVNMASGREEFVHTAYIMCPHECTPDAIENIKRELGELAGRVTFVCGIELLALFRKHWVAFLQFESAVLTKYLAELKAGISVDEALISLLTRQHPIGGLKPFESFYVPGRIEMWLGQFEAPPVRAPRLGMLDEYLTKTELDDLIERLTFWRHSLRSPDVHRVGLQDLTAAREFISRLTKHSERLWDEALHSQRKREGLTEEVMERLLSCASRDKEGYELCCVIFGALQQDMEAVAESSRRLRRYARQSQNNIQELLKSTELAESSAALDYLSAVPGFIQYSRGDALAISPEDLFSPGKATLIVGPPGSGKTSFCRWQTQQAIDRFGSPDAPLPIYVPAHRLSSAAITCVEDVIFGFTKLADLWPDTGVRHKLSLRLFLDGLDEVPERSRQREIISAIQSALKDYKFLSVMITSRPYVWGPWLNWLPRLHMAEMNPADQLLLAKKWLDDDVSVKSFFKDLNRSSALVRLMGTPLIATLILNLYRRTPAIPETKAALYRSFIDLYCGGWDSAKGVYKAGRFGQDQKFRPLTALAYRLHLQKLTECSESTLATIIGEVAPAMANEAAGFVQEIVQDGILVRAGRHVMFSHLSFQEYLAAQYLPSDPAGERAKQALRAYLKGDDWWKEVVEFYVISREDPTAVAAWIRKTAEGLQARGIDTSTPSPGLGISHKLEGLRSLIWESFPGFDATDLLVTTKEKVRRRRQLGSPN